MYASARRFFARLGSEIFLSSLQSGFFITLLSFGCGRNGVTSASRAAHEKLQRTVRQLCEAPRMIIDISPGVMARV
jgi:16S rRNA G1207 methylase RsmC